MVVTCFPAARDSGVLQERTGRPSRCPVQAPHCATPQPYFVPVRPRCSRKTQSRGVEGSTSTCTLRLFTVREITGINLHISGGHQVEPATGKKSVRAGASTCLHSYFSALYVFNTASTRSGRNGDCRRRRPVAEKKAFATAGPTPIPPRSPIPTGLRVEGTICVCTSGASDIRRT